MKNRVQLIFAAICAVALVAAFALVGCSSGGSSSSSASASGSASESSAASSSSAAAASAEPVELTIYAANSLQKALPEVEALYTEKNPNVTFVETEDGFAASGTLVEKLTQEPTAADILITASASSMDDAEGASLVDSATRATMFTNDLVICVAENSTLTISSVEDLATNSEITSIAMGEPNAVPAGNYALQTLVSAGLATGDKSGYEFDASIADKMNAGADKVGTVASYVSSGQCQAGFVYSSDLYRYDGIKPAYTVPADMHKDIVYPGAVCSKSENAEAAAAFLKFCMADPDAQKIFADYGFELVEA